MILRTNQRKTQANPANRFIENPSSCMDMGTIPLGRRPWLLPDQYPIMILYSISHLLKVLAQAKQSWANLRVISLYS